MKGLLGSDRRTPPTWPQAAEASGEGIAESAFRAVRVRWFDAAHTAHRWEDRQEVVDRVVEAQKVPIVSVGHLVHEDENGVLVCVSVNELDDVAECVSIPRSVIVAMDDLRDPE